MAKQDYTPHQQNIISNYYDRLDTIMLAKLQEMVSDLYLADTRAKQDRLWKRIHQAMSKLGVPPAIVEHIMVQRNVEVLAKNVQDWLKNTKASR